MKQTILQTLENIAKIIFRRHSVGITLIKVGGLIVVASVAGGWAISISTNAVQGQFDASLTLPSWLLWAVIPAGFLLIFIGIMIEIWRLRKGDKINDKRKVLSIELRGLRMTNDSLLDDWVPKNFPGQQERMLIDLREGIIDGEITSPESSIKRVLQIPEGIRQRFGGENKRDFTLVFGGLAPVPFLFLSGVLCDDESAIEVVDWDRAKSQWRKLDEDDDGDRYIIQDLSQLEAAHVNEVALLISSSYKIDLADVRTKIPRIPIVSLELGNGVNSPHWSGEKQRNLAFQFFETSKTLAAFGIKKIHLFLAAQSSLAFNLGRAYDRRNLPELIVYQYKQDRDGLTHGGLRCPRQG